MIGLDVHYLLSIRCTLIDLVFDLVGEGMSGDDVCDDHGKFSKVEIRRSQRVPQQ